MTMAMDWYEYLKKYVWDEHKTPFLVNVGKLNKSQADSEIFLYALFLSAPGALVGVAAVSHGLQAGIDGLALIGAYGFSLCAGDLIAGDNPRDLGLFIHIRQQHAISPLVAPGFRQQGHHQDAIIAVDGKNTPPDTRADGRMKYGFKALLARGIGKDQLPHPPAVQLAFPVQDAGTESADNRRQGGFPRLYQLAGDHIGIDYLDTQSCESFGYRAFAGRYATRQDDHERMPVR